MRVDVGIIGAMDAELKTLIGALSERKSEVAGGIEFHTGIIHNKRVAIAKCGIGKVFVAICAEAMVMKYSPTLIVNTGVGGALARGISATDIVIADKLCQHDMDTSAIGDPKGLVSGINKIYFDSDARAVEILRAASDTLGYTAHVGTIATGDKFIADREEKKSIEATFGAMACEMEGGAVAHTAYVNGVPFAVIRAISDSADGDAGMDYPTFLPIAAERSAALTLALIKEY